MELIISYKKMLKELVAITFAYVGVLFFYQKVMSSALCVYVCMCMCMFVTCIRDLVLSLEFYLIK